LQGRGEHLTPVADEVARLADLRTRYEALRELAVQASAL